MKFIYKIQLVILLVILWGQVITAVHARESIVIGALYSFSGLAAQSNLPSIHGVRFAVEEINANGGVLNMPLKLLEIDNLSTPIGAKVAAEKAVQEEVTAIVGSAWSSHTLQSAKVAQAHGIPLISNVSTHPDITGIGDYIFRVCFNDLYQGWAMAKFARQDLELRRAVVFTDITSDYSIELTQSFTTTFEHLGGEVVKKISYKRNTINHQRLLAEAAQFNPDVFFIPGLDESALIAGETQRLGLNTVLMGADGWDLESFYAKGGNQILHGYFSTHWTENLNNDISRAFVKKYKKKEAIFAPEALAYDAVYLLANAIRSAGSLDRKAIRDTLAATKSFQGVTGPITFDQRGDPLKNIVIMELKNGRPRYLNQIQPHDGAIDFFNAPSLKQ